MTTSLVRTIDAADGWRRLVLDAPPGNVLSLEVVRQVTVAVNAAAGLRALRWLTIEGSGGEFSYGASIPEHLPEPMRDVLPAMHALCQAVLTFPTPTAALVEGRCLGGGFELALCCDDIIATETASFGLPEIRLGAFPPVAAALLPIRVGASRAARAILAGDTHPAAYWREAGLVSLASNALTLERAAHDWFTQHLARHSAAALSHAVLAAREVWRPAAERAISANEARYLQELLATHDASEGILAWMEKRPAVWRHE